MLYDICCILYVAMCLFLLFIGYVVYVVPLVLCVVVRCFFRVLLVLFNVYYVMCIV